jgi:hypothetical protein
MDSTQHKNNGRGDSAAQPLTAGTQTGSLMNHIFSGCNMPAPEIGMGATILHWTDRTACTITAISKSGKRVEVVEDNAIRTDDNGMSDSQSYRYEPGTGSARAFTLRKNGAWVAEGQSMKGTRLAIGARRHYYDYSF